MSVNGVLQKLLSYIWTVSCCSWHSRTQVS